MFCNLVSFSIFRFVGWRCMVHHCDGHHLLLWDKEEEGGKEKREEKGDGCQKSLPKAECGGRSKREGNEKGETKRILTV